MSKRNTEKKMKLSSFDRTTSVVELGIIYQKELEVLQQEVRKKAALASFYKLQPKNKMTVEEFLSEIKEHKEIWQQVCEMALFDFAHAILGSSSRKNFVEKYEKKASKRTRLNDEQKELLKSIIVHVLSMNESGLNRQDIAMHVQEEKLQDLNIVRKELASKLRQPLAELIAEGNIYSQGAKRLLKYHVRL